MLTIFLVGYWFLVIFTCYDFPLCSSFYRSVISPTFKCTTLNQLKKNSFYKMNEIKSYRKTFCNTIPFWENQLLIIKKKNLDLQRNMVLLILLLNLWNKERKVSFVWVHWFIFKYFKLCRLSVYNVTGCLHSIIQNGLLSRTLVHTCTLKTIWLLRKKNIKY